MPGPRVNPKVGRKDEVFVATATEPLRKHKSSDHQPEAQKKRIKAKAEEIVEKAKKKKKS
jgi:hypothetical protein